MSVYRLPQPETIREQGLLEELQARTQSWLPEWRPRDSQDFASAILAIAARFQSEVAQRFNRVPEKFLRGYLDWVGIKGDSGHAARLPFVFTTKKGAEGILARSPIQVQATPPQTDSSKTPSPVLFETESSLLIVPAKIAALVGAAASADAYYLPPQGISPVAAPVSGPRSWQLKSAAKADAVQLQLEPALGFDSLPTLRHRTSGRPYQVVGAAGDIVTIDPPLETSAGAYEQDDTFDLVEMFDPFGTSNRNAQQHELYIGSESLLNLPTASTIEVGGLTGDYTWKYWGKLDGESNPDWQSLTPVPGGSGIKLNKDPGSVELLALGGNTSRWLKASATPPTTSITVPKITLAVNADKCTADTPCPPANDQQRSQVKVEGIANTTPLVLNQAFFPLGQQPRLFDAFYLGCPEAFSKPDACVKICLEALDGTAQSLTAVMVGGASMMFWIGADGYLHRMNQLGSALTAQSLTPVRPPINSDGSSTHGQAPIALVQNSARLSVVSASNSAYAAVIADKEVWIWTETGTDGTWEPLNPFPGPYQGKSVSQVLILNDGAQKRIVALVGTSLLEVGWSKGNPGTWSVVGSDQWQRIAPVFNQANILSGGSFADGWIAISKTNEGDLYYFAPRAGGGSSQQVAPIATEKLDGDFTPLAVRAGGSKFLLAAQLKGAASPNLAAWHVDQSTPATPTKLAAVSVALHGAEFDWIPTAASGIAVVFAEQGAQGTDGRVNIWYPEASGAGAPDPTLLYPSALAGDMAGSPAVVSKIVFTPGARGGVIAMTIDPTLLEQITLAKSSVASAVILGDPAQQPQIGDVMSSQFTGSMTVWAKTLSTAPKSIPSSTQTWLRVHKSGDNRPVAQVGFYHPDATTVSTNLISAADNTIDVTGETNPNGTYTIRVSPPAKGSTIHTLTLTSPAGVKTGVVDPPIPGLVDGDPFKYTHLTSLHISPASIRPLVKVPATALPSVNQNGVFLSGAVPWPNPELAQDSVADEVVLSLPWSQGPRRSSGNFTLWRNDIFGTVSVIADAKTANPTLSWEYFDGQSWWKIDGLQDATGNLRSTGTVQFCVPQGLAQSEVAGRKSYWIRARLIGGDYGPETISVSTVHDPVTGGTIQKITRLTSGITPPQLGSVNVYYSLCSPALPDYVLTKDGGVTRNQTAANDSGNAQVELFLSLGETLTRLGQNKEDPSLEGSALYVGFDTPFSGGPLGILFLVDEGANADAFPLQMDVLLSTGFEAVLVKDGTRGLNESGVLLFDLSTPPMAASLFGPGSRYWIRLRPRNGFTGVWTPQIQGAYLNAVFAGAFQTHNNERLGSSDGSPNQKVQLVFPPVLAGSLALRVKEPLSDQEIAQLKLQDPNAVLDTLANGEPGPWVQWSPTNDITAAGSKDRAYQFDTELGEILFGDGNSGRIPPIGANSILALTYKTVGGDDANGVAAWSQTNLVSQLLGIDTVLIPQAAAGGAGPQSPAEVLRFAPANQFARDRALTLADFEGLALQSSRDIVQARAFTTFAGVRLAVVMRGAVRTPSQSQVRELERYLAARAVPDLASGGALEIKGPRVLDLKLNLALNIGSLEDSGSVSEEATSRIQQLLDPATGGFDGQGWPLGEWPDRSDLAARLIDIARLEEIVDIGLAVTNQATPTTPTPLDLPQVKSEDIHFDLRVPSLEAAS